MMSSLKLFAGRSTSVTARASSRHTFRPSVEMLESRWQPADFAWNPDPQILPHWTSGANWNKWSAAAGQYLPQPVGAQFAPGVGDIAVFGASNTANCWVNGDIVLQGVRVGSGYTGALVIPSNQSLTVSGGTGFKSFLFESPGAAVRAPNQGEFDGYSDSGGVVRIDSGSKLEWKAGVFDRMGVVISKDATAIVSTDGLKRQADSYIVVDGRLDWSSGDVQTVSTSGAAGSQLAITQTGEFNIYATGGLWGTGPGVSSEFLVSNYGTTTVSAGGVVTIGGDYINSGTTSVNKGTFKVTGRAESTGIVIMRDRASVDVTAAADNTLYILRGSIHGDGTVMGNLSLSKNGATQWEGGRVVPGWGDPGEAVVPGVINVTSNFRMWTGGCMVWLECNASGVTSRLEVAGTAYLTGRVHVAWSHDYKPAAGTVLTFMTWGWRVGQFGEHSAVSPVWHANGRDHNINFDFYSDVRGVVVTDETGDW